MRRGGPPPSSDAEPPRQFPSVPPPADLHPTSDIRFVMIEIGKLTVKVDRLIDDVKSHGEKIDGVRHQISFVKGAVWVLGALVAIAIGAVTLYLKIYSH